MTPPPIHDSDRKAAMCKEIAVALFGTSATRFDELPKNIQDALLFMVDKVLAIITRHHAEERAVEVKVRKALEEVFELWDKHDGHLTTHFSSSVSKKMESYRAALRTASQSPTEGKT